jgi:hypothetical protein
VISIAERTYRKQFRQSTNEKAHRRQAFELLKLYVKALEGNDILIAEVPDIVIVNNVRLVLKGMWVYSRGTQT